MPLSSLGAPESGATVCWLVEALGFAVVSEGGEPPAAMASKLVPGLSWENARLSLPDKDLSLPGGEVRRELCWLVANLTASLSA
jgi:hypothetical protein